MLIIILVVTNIYFVLDLVLQASCRTVHDDLSWITSQIMSKIIIFDGIHRSIVFYLDFIDDATSETTVSINFTTLLNNTIDDCRNRSHFVGTFMKIYKKQIDNGIEKMMIILDRSIRDTFIVSIDQFDIQSYINRLKVFGSLANVPAVTDEIQTMARTLTDINDLLRIISQSNISLPSGLVASTIDQVC
jgi:hypothetical protein